MIVNRHWTHHGGSLDDLIASPSTITITISFFLFLSFLFCHKLLLSIGFPSGSEVKNLPARLEPQEMWVQSMAWEDPLKEGMATHSSILA